MVMEDVLSGRLTETVQVGPRDSDLPILAPTPALVTRPTPDQYDSPAYWLTRLLRELDVRRDPMLRWNAYYEGTQPMAFASEKFRDAFGGRFRVFSSNFSALVVDGTRERLEVQGFQMSNARSAKRAWALWQDNDMDAWSQIAHTEALVKGACYVLVEPPNVLRDVPVMTVEDALDTITASDPRDRRTRLAGLKRWVGDDKATHLVLYMRDAIYKLRGKGGQMEPDPGPGEDWPLPNSLGDVPLVPLLNRPRLDGMGRSEIQPVMSNQDAINKLRADALVAAEFAAFRQRWAIGIDIPQDPKTGAPVEPFKAAVDRLWVTPPPDPDDPNPPDVKFGEFSATDLEPYQRMIESEIGQMSSISRMPYHYLLGQPEAVPPSGESLKSSESGLVAKVRTTMVHLGEGWEEAMRLALLSVGDRGGRDRMATTVWRDPETRNEGVRADATVKLYQAGIIDQDEARAAVGYAPMEPDQVTEVTEPTPQAPDQDIPVQDVPGSDQPEPDDDTLTA